MSEWIIATFTFLRYVGLDIEIPTIFLSLIWNMFQLAMALISNIQQKLIFSWLVWSGGIFCKNETLSILSSSHCAWTPQAIFWTCHWCCAHLMKRGEAESEIFLSTSPSFFPFPSGSFTNYVDKIWPIIDHLQNPCCHLWRIRFEK